jgi:hypothetical protein
MTKRISFSFATIFSVVSLNAIEFKPIGLKAMSMGGAGVADTKSAVVGYYNPALVQLNQYSHGISINASGRYSESNIIDNMDFFEDIEIEDTINDFSNLSQLANREVYVSLNGNSLQFADNTTTLDNLDDATVDTLNNMTDNSSAVNIADGVTILKKDGKLVAIKESSLNPQESDKFLYSVDSIKKAIDLIQNDVNNHNGFMFGVTSSLNVQITQSLAIGVYDNIDSNLNLQVNDQYNRIITNSDPNNTPNDYTDDIFYEYDLEKNLLRVLSDDIWSNSTPSNTYQKYSIEYANDNGFNYIEISAKNLKEIPITYARGYDLSSGFWSFGVNIKPISLSSYYHRIALGASNDDIEDIIDKYKTTYESTIGLDFGIAYKPTSSNLVVGVSAKNINSPQFKIDQAAMYDGENYIYTAQKYTIDPMVRVGASLGLYDNSVELAFDADLTRNDRLVNDDKSQYIGMGVEIQASNWFAMRFGITEDLAAEELDDGTIITAGIGLGSQNIHFDLALMSSLKQGKYDNKSIPSHIAGSFALTMKWGDRSVKNKIFQNKRRTYK